MLKKGLLVIGFTALLLSGCKTKSEQSGGNYFDKSGMDTSVRPGDNFFLYANGKWIKTTTIPDDQSGWGSFYTLYSENQKKLRDILKEAADKKIYTQGSIEQKVGDYYASGMDTITIEKIGAQPLLPVLNKIDSIQNYQDFTRLVAELHKTGNGFLLGFYVGPDEMNSNMNIAVFTQAGLTLPEKDYYTRTDSISVLQRNMLKEYAIKLFELTGTQNAGANVASQQLLTLETEIAKSHLSPEDLRDPIKNYNKMSVTQLAKIAPAIDWNTVFITMGIAPDSLNVAQPKYFEALGKLLQTQPIEAWKAKLKFDYIRSNAIVLSKDFRDAQFNFSKIFTGQKIQKERWKTLVELADEGLKDLLSQLYVQKYFPPEAKVKMEELVGNLQKAFKIRIQNLDWMTDSTKAKALAKLDGIIKKIGYPDTWKSFDDVTIKRHDFFGNNVALDRHEYNEMVEKIGKPVDKTEWGMTPATVNAYYNPSFNEIVFPAGILQPPFFDPKADDAINYGAIGMVIGHEITHGFDDQGRQYDLAGNLNDWWGNVDASKFNERADKVVKQYDAYTIFDSMHLSGKLTLGENLADLGGLAIAYDAFKMTGQGKSDKKVDGFTPDQRFFLGFAQVWRLKNRDETMRVRVTTDPHSPEMFRVNGPLSNFTPFYKAFNVQPGDKMYKPEPERIKVW